MPAPWTDSKIIDQTVALMKEIGQSPVVTKKEVNGFILNRLQYAVIMEAWRLVEVSESFSRVWLIHEPRTPLLHMPKAEEYHMNAPHSQV